MRKRHPEIENAVAKIVMVCGALSPLILDEFVSHVAYQYGYDAPDNYFSEHLAKAMVSSRVLHQLKDGRYTLNPASKADWKAEDALWVFMEHMDGVELSDIMKGPYPAQLTYYKAGRIYHIVRCDKDGALELGLAREIEKETESRRLCDEESGLVEERFFFVFSAQDYLNLAPKTTLSPAVNVLVQIENRNEPPQIKFAAAR